MELEESLSLTIILFLAPGDGPHGHKYNNQFVVSAESKTGKPNCGLGNLNLMS